MAVDALIFDDDTFFAGLVSEILKDQGLTVKYFPDGGGALEHIRREKPGLVLVDVMMPGLDGITLCSQVKVDPQVSWTKVVVVTGKPYPQERERAATAKADLFVEKPFNVTEFSQKIRQLIPRGAGVRTESGGAWSLRLWGNAEDVGCASFSHQERLFVMDAGAGLDCLAAVPPEPGTKEVWLLLTHLHPRHVSGLAQAQRWLKAGLRLHVAGPVDGESSLINLARKELPFPSVAVHPLSEGEYGGLPGMRLRTISTMHPGPCLGYRLEAEGRRIAFIPDNELAPDWETELTDYGEKLLSFVKGVDLLVHDARYCDGDYSRSAGQGHSCPAAALRLALRARARRLLLYHADARYDSKDRQDMLSHAHAAASTEMAPPACLLASAGLEVAV